MIYNRSRGNYLVVGGNNPGNGTYNSKRHPKRYSRYSIYILTANIFDEKCEIFIAFLN